ncbi:MAG: phosphatase PAP2 family protein [Desulfurococcales archaeon]|nr:phosphatase PAP2 family protein [Desulfurococcales archaeon]
MGIISCITRNLDMCIALTYTGSASVIILLLIILIKIEGYKWLHLSIGLLTASVVNEALKIFIGAPRPPAEEWIVSAEGPGFPSGHAAITSAFWTLVYMSSRDWILLLAGSMHIIGVGLSRVELGVHYPIDVIGGVVQGSLTAYITLLLINKSNIKNIDYYIIIILLIVSLSLLYMDPVLKTPLVLSTASIILLILLYKFKSKIWI